ncbi:MAG: SMC-Scp complex subunit ScpB, partial [Eubacterium sp.]|jgi:segregation and condensation protein B|nr:SMC-Scp complex subunit ScpB [Eubacterium sp.]
LALDGGFQLATRTEYASYVKKALVSKRQVPLSQAAMECLSIIAYNQPVTKSLIEQVRGIDSNYVVNTLVERGLIADAGRLDLPGKPMSYKTTDTFLRCFGLRSLAELPAPPLGEEQLNFDSLEELHSQPPVFKDEDADSTEADPSPEFEKNASGNDSAIREDYSSIDFMGSEST